MSQNDQSCQYHKNKINITKKEFGIPSLILHDDSLAVFNQPEKLILCTAMNQINRNGITIRLRYLTGYLLKRRWDLNDYAEIAHTRLF